MNTAPRMLSGRFGSVSLALVLVVFVVHAILRFAGLWHPMYVPVSMAMLWPLPWLLLSKDSRYEVRFRTPVSKTWFFRAPLVGACLVAACATIGWLAFGDGDSNWFTKHALVLKDSLAPAPTNASVASLFMMVTIPAMIFSPLGEEFLFRGFMLRTLELRWGYRAAILIQAAIFAFVHLAHYGLNPLQPALIAVWLPSTFAIGLVLGWVVSESGSIWCAVIAHSIFNLGLNATVFILLPNLVAV